ncbi:MAG: HAMP domain-containing protein [Chloroflexi bacterium]|nr:HAMP domain-containing protein [Chloroflexota bacterium]
MSLRQKSLLITVLLLIALVLLLSLLVRTLLLGDYAALQAQDTRANLQRALNALQRAANEFAINANDYGRWDNSVDFVQTLDPEYVESDIPDETFVAFAVNTMIFTDGAGQVVFSKSVDLLEETPVETPAALLAYVSGTPALNRHADNSSRTAGFALLPTGPALLVSVPIRASDDSGPLAGALVWIRLLDAQQIAVLSEITQLALDLRALNDAQLPDDFRAAASALASQPSYVQTLPGERSAAYGLLNDFNGAPAFILRVDTPNSIYAQGDSSSWTFIGALLAAGVFTVVVAALMLDWLVLRRLASLSADLRAITESQSLSARVTVAGQDELATLGTDINQMLATLERGQNELRAAKEAAEQSNRVKSAFLANMSHELRTPLNAIMGFLTLMMMNGKLDSKDAYRAQRAHANSERLLNTINDILDISRIEAGRLQIVPSAVSVRDVVESVRTQIDVLADEKQLKLETSVQAHVPPLIESDSEALTKIITNLLSNGIKFTERGSVTLTIDATPAKLIIAVQDTGIGIPPHMRDLIFESFRQVDESSTRAYGGTGLGLTIVQSLCTALGGSIRVESEVGVGSTFIVTLPLQILRQEVA